MNRAENMKVNYATRSNVINFVIQAIQSDYAQSFCCLPDEHG